MLLWRTMAQYKHKNENKGMSTKKVPEVRFSTHQEEREV
jgi:hypothetical protein